MSSNCTTAHSGLLAMGDDITFLDLVVHKIECTGMQDFMKSWLQQTCKDFRIVFIDKDLSGQQRQMLKYALGFAKALGLEKNICVVDDEKDIPEAKQTKNLESTFEKASDKFEVLKIKSKFDEKIKQQKNENIIQDSMPVVCEQKFIQTSFPIVSVVITTHNRTTTACTTIRSLIKNIKYNNLRWIIADDRSKDGHIDSLINEFKLAGINDVIICKTTKDHFGLGASLNNGLKKAFQFSSVVLTTEDDWFLQKELDLYKYVKTISDNKDIAAIRLAAVCYAKTRPSKLSGFVEVFASGQLDSVFNNQVALRHRRVYDKIGYYEENISTDVAERTMIKKYNTNAKNFHVLFPSFIKQNTLNDQSLFFLHFGESTQGHKFTALKSAQKKVQNTINHKIDILPIVTIVMTTHNRTRVACAVIDSLCKNLKYDGKIKWCISDDRSKSGHIEKLIQQFKVNNINGVHIEQTNSKRYGLGASLNNGLRYAWTNSDIVLTTEDDWILEKPLDITKYVKAFNDKSIQMIRLGAIDTRYSLVSKCNNMFNFVDSDNRSKITTCNLQVALRHKRIYDTIGYYIENQHSNIVERDFIIRYNKKFSQNKKHSGVVVLSNIRPNTLDDKSLFFIHIGNSLVGHKYKIPARYNYLNY